MNRKKKIIIVNLENNYNQEIDGKGCDYFIVSRGQVKIKKAKLLSLGEIRKKYINKVKKIFLNNYKKKISDLKKKIPYYYEIETFNLRNDKNNSIDLILNILLIKQYIKKKKYDKIEIITDHDEDELIFKNFSKKLLIKKIGSIKKKKNWLILKLTKFYIKAFFICLIARFFKQRAKIKNKVVLSIYPLFYNRDKENFFADDNSLKLNFLLTDETHLNSSFIKILNNLIECKNYNLIHVESLISSFDIIRSYILSLIEVLKFKNDYFKFKFENLDFSIILKNDLSLAFLNRLKLNIYNKKLSHFFKDKNIKAFHFFLFEYNFGFYLNHLIKKNNKDILRVGYQHGIFSSNLLWMELLNKLKSKIFPNKIIYFSKISRNAYSHFFPNIYKEYRKKNISDICKKIRYSNDSKIKKILVLPGTHDAKDVLNFINKKSVLTNNQKIFYFKFHPKMDINIQSTKYLKKITNLQKLKFNDVYISQTSTLVYDFMKYKKKFRLIELAFKMNLLKKRDSRKLNFELLK